MTKSVFVGALSFEWRSTAGILEWSSSVSSGLAVLIDYGDSATPGDEARVMRQESYEFIRSNLASSVELRRVSVNAYSMSSFEDAVAPLLNDGELTMDITCLTRPHVASAARLLSSADSRDWSIKYTAPLSYGASNGRSVWRDTLVLPLGDDTAMDNPGVLLGLLLPGFDTDRLVVAFDDLEADAGIVVVSETPERPDFHRHAISKVRDFARFLKSLAITGNRGNRISSSLGHEGWFFESVSLPDVVMSSARFSYRLVAAARSVSDEHTKPAPIVLYPFGPKIVVFCFTYWLTSLHADYSWMVYPIAETHNLDYTQGIGESWTLASAEFDILTNVDRADITKV